MEWYRQVRGGLWLRALSVTLLVAGMAYGCGDDEGPELAPTALASDGFTVYSGPTSLANIGFVTLPSGGSSAVYTCTTLPWSLTIPQTQWISPNANCTANEPTGIYMYKMFFTVTPGVSNILLSGWVQADDSVTVTLNGTTVPLTPSTFGSNFQMNSGVHTGNTNPNTLIFTVNNISGPTGLDFMWSVSWTSPVGGGGAGGRS
jgi:hypothetical protein